MNSKLQYKKNPEMYASECKWAMHADACLEVTEDSSNEERQFECLL